MNFDLIAKDLIHSATIQQIVAGKKNSDLEKLNLIDELARAGFDRQNIFRDLRELYENTREDSIKTRIMDMMVKIHGLYQTEETPKPAPTIQINIINGDNTRLANMLCPEII